VPELKTSMGILFNEIKQSGLQKKYEGKFLSKNGVPYDVLWVTSMINSGKGTTKTIVSIGIDINERKKYEENIKYMAYYDSLTKLPNRAMFVNEISEFISNGNKKFAIAYLDIDNFKYINDTLGHHVGDELLKYMGDRFLSIIKQPDIVARLGGDEFALLISEFETEEKLLIKIDEIVKSIGSTWNLNSHEFFISMSIGIAIYPDSGNDVNTLLKNSDIAMYVAKKNGKNKALIYEEDIHEDTIWNIHMANKIQRALENNEFSLYYQPQIELLTGEIVGMEALIRWNHPTAGFISPADFIPVAEQTGQIYVLEQRIFKNCLIQKKKWEDEGFKDIELSINLSSKTLISVYNFKQIELIISEFDVNYSKIVIEITETALISNIDLAINHLNILKIKGLKIALDDFGTGYSSITYIKNLPIDIIKLDKSYIGLVLNGGIDSAIVKCIVSLAEDSLFSVVAEGIESSEQLEYLKKINCRIGQGFYIGRPAPIEKINELLKNN
ncbi:MAG: putative bifunctional diguanylate cyclase/phosphodiesterase, partial [Sedimentibacter sp.]